MAHLCHERKTVYDEIAEALGEWPEWLRVNFEKRENIIKQLERGAHSYTIDICDENGYDKRFDSMLFVITYSSIAYKLIGHLCKSDLNKKLFDRLLSGEIEPIKLAEMSHDDLCPEANRAIREELDLRKNQRVQKKVSTLYTCRNCKKNRTTIRETQTRSADEGSTLQIACENCGHHWSQY